jgi:hypothetical protein
VANSGKSRTPPPEFWPKVPVDDEFRDWLTVGFERKVLVVIRTVTTLTRLLDVVSLFGADRRVQLVFTHDSARPAILGEGVPEFLQELRAPVIGWTVATKTRFDLAIAASENDALQELDAPILLVPHGIGYQKYYPGSAVTSGMNPEKLLHQGEVVPAAIALSHTVQREQLAAACPEALGTARVVGDPCYDRMIVSRHRANRYRAALGTGTRVLVVICSTWGRDSLFGTHPELPEKLLAELPMDEYQVAVTLHPGVWAAHGQWQIHAWLDAAKQAGLVLVAPEKGWQATILAADCVISDEGSAALYAAAVDKPLLLASTGNATTVAESPLAALARTVPSLDFRHELRGQIDFVRRAYTLGDHEPVVKQAVDSPGQAAGLLGELLYRLLDLPLPATRPFFPPVPDPSPPETQVSAYLAGISGDVLTRFPAGVHVTTELEFRHIVAHADNAELRHLDGAAIVYTDDPDRLADLLTLWPSARLAAATAGNRCVIRLHDGTSVELSAPDVDPLSLASLAYTKLAAHQEICGTHLLGDVEVTAIRLS